MKHRMVTLQLHRTGVILVVVGSLLLGASIFACGYLAGMRNANAKPGATGARPAVSVVPAVTVPKPSADALKARPSSAEMPRQLSIRAGLFTSNEEATKFAQQLIARKLDATVSATATSSGAMLYSVQIGQYANRRAAAAAVAALKRDLGIDAAVVAVQPEPLRAPIPNPIEPNGPRANEGSLSGRDH